MTLLDGMPITGDGLGDYVHGIDSVYIDVETAYRHVWIDLTGHQVGELLFKRSVYIRFDDVLWEDLVFKPVDPILPSDRYCISTITLILEDATLISPIQIGIGFPTSPTSQLAYMEQVLVSQYAIWRGCSSKGIWDFAIKP